MSFLTPSDHSGECRDPDSEALSLYASRAKRTSPPRHMIWVPAFAGMIGSF
jgi:hypothetical protein